MSDNEFSPAVRKALDQYRAPVLPNGFSDRLIARIESSDMGSTAVSSVAPPIGRLRNRRFSPWGRSGRIIGSIVGLSLMTATAAAAGIFGDPVYMPGITEVLEKTELVTPRHLMTAKPKATIAAKPAITDPVEVTDNMPTTGAQAIVARVGDLREDPAYRALPPAQRLAIARKEVQTMVRSGQASPQDVKAAVRELARNADPALKAQWREQAATRKAARLQRRETVAPAPSTPSAASQDAPQTVTSEADVAMTNEQLPEIATATLSPEKAEALRERFRDATPEQRAALREALRERRQSRTGRRTQ
jgi:hypothetical protein